MHRILFILLFQTLLLFGGFAQNQDSIEVMRLINQAFEIQETNQARAKLIALKALQLSKKKNFVRGSAYAYNRLGALAALRGEVDSAAFFLNQAIAIRKQLKSYESAAGSAIVLGEFYARIGNLDSAQSALLQALKMAEISNDSMSIALCFRSLAALNLSLGDFSGANESFEKARNISNTQNDSLTEGLSLTGLGNVAYARNEFDDALSYYLIANSIFEMLGAEVNKWQNLNNLALTYEALGKYKLAKASHNQVVDYYLKKGLTIDYLNSSCNLAFFFNNQNQPDSALAILFEILPEAHGSGDLSSLNLIYDAISDAFELKNDFKTALDFQRRFVSARDSILNIQKIQAIAEMQTKYETEKKDQEILLLDEQNKAKTSQRNFLIAASGALLLGLMFLGVIYFNRLRLNRKNEQLAQERISGLIKEQEAKTYNALLEGQEEERKRIGTELHDRLGSILSTTKLMFSSLEEKIALVSDHQNQNFEKLNHMLDEAVTEVRRVSHDLHSGTVAGFGLVAAVKQQLDNIDQNSDINCSMNVFGMETRLQNSIELNVYRMIQEVLNNILKHAKASKISLQITRSASELNIMIEDDGVGFDVKTIEGKSGIGLKNLVMRAEKLGGIYHIDSQIGKGTTSIIEIPLSAIKIAIADDHQMFVDGLKSILETMPEMQLVIEANNGKQLLGQLAQTKADVVLMDINMPEMDGLEATRRIVAEYPKMKVLMITMHDKHDYIQKLLKAGAHGYILKNTGKQELETAIKTVYADQSYYSQQVTQRIMDHLSGQKQMQSDLHNMELTQRETDVLKLIAAELTTVEIAEKLCISAHTVESHRKNLLAKLQVKNSLGLVKYAMKMGLVE